MKPGTALPWISLLLIVVAVISPPGREILRDLSSGEQLSPSIAQFMVMVYFGGLFGLALIEFGVRFALIRRTRRRMATGTSASSSE